MQILNRTVSLGGLPAMLLLVSTGAAQDKFAPADVKPLVTLYGSDSKITKSRRLRITTAREWAAVWAEHQTGSADGRPTAAALDLDFDKVMVIALFGGECSFQDHYSCLSVTERSDRLVIRVDEHPFQVAANAALPRLRPWGVFVLPRSDKRIVLETDRRTLIQDPPRWREWASFPALRSRGRP
jgi:hypothetical protein